MSILSAILIDQPLGRSARKTDVRPIVERISWFLRRSDDTCGDKFIKSTLHFVMRHAVASIEFRDAAFDLRDGHELLDRVLDGRIGRQFSQQVDNAIACEAFGHDRILRFVAISGHEERPVVAWVGSELGPRIFRPCKSFEEQHFAPACVGRSGSWGRIPPPRALFGSVGHI